MRLARCDPVLTSLLQFAVRHRVPQGEPPVGFEHRLSLLSAQEPTDLLLERYPSSLRRHFQLKLLPTHSDDKDLTAEVGLVIGSHMSQGSFLAVMIGSRIPCVLVDDWRFVVIVLLQKPATRLILK